MLDSVIDVGSEVLFAYQLNKASATHGLHRLFVRVTEDQLYAVFGTVVVEVFQSIHSGCIKRRNAAHADDQVLGERLYRNIGNTVGHAKEHRAVDFVNAYALGQFTQMRNLGVCIAVVLPAFNLGFFADHLHEQYDSDDHANADSSNQVECDG